MNITVSANKFCPDNCKFCEMQKEMLWVEGKVEITTNLCKNAELCKFAYELNKEVGYGK